MAKASKKKHSAEALKAEKTLALSPKKLGISLGILWGGYLLLLSVLAGIIGWGSAAVRMLGSLYIGYDMTLLGAILGGAWGFGEGFIFGWLLAYIYNKLCA